MKINAFAITETKKLMEFQNKISELLMNRMKITINITRNIIRTINAGTTPNMATLYLCHVHCQRHIPEQWNSKMTMTLILVVVLDFGMVFKKEFEMIYLLTTINSLKNI